MAGVLKCKMCGGDLRIISGLNIAECEYCGTRQSVPKTPDERKTSYFNRANEARRANEFDKAIGIYESIVAEYPDEAEAYWGLCLCKFGIEYVDDPKTRKKIPTCHRTAYDSIFEDKDYNSAISHGDMDQIRVFKQEAGVIDRIQKSILNSVNLENPYDVFICYKETDERTGQRTQESVIGQELFENLCSRDIRTFFARVSLEDVLGEEYEPHIFAALNSARIMLVLGSSNSNYNAPWVRNEWSRYLELARKDKAHSIIPCFINMDPYDLPNEFSNLQAQDLGKVGAIQDIIRGIEKILGKTQLKSNKSIRRDEVSSSGIDAVYERGKISLRNGEWKKAQAYFDEALNKDPRNADVYAYLLMIENKCRSLEELAQSEIPIKNSSNFKNALEFADDEFGKKLRKISATIDRRYSLIKRRKKKIILVTTIIIVLLAGVGLAVFAWVKTTPQRVYKKAAKLIDEEAYKDAYEFIKNNKNIDGLTELYERSLLGYATSSIENGDYDFAYSLLEEVDSSEEKDRLINNVNCTIELKAIEESNHGDIVTFGSYPQSDVNGEKSDPIEWYVIGRDKDKAVLLSKNNLEYIHGHNGNNKKTIEDSFGFLSDAFYNTAFTNTEKEYICPVIMQILDDKEVDVNVFILNTAMVFKLSEIELIGTTTDYAANKGALRAGNQQNTGVWLVDYSNNSQNVWADSIIKYVGVDGNVITTKKMNVGLRPAICIKLKSDNSRKLTENEVASMIPDNSEPNSEELSVKDGLDEMEDSYISDHLSCKCYIEKAGKGYEIYDARNIVIEVMGPKGEQLGIRYVISNNGSPIKEGTTGYLKPGEKESIIVDWPRPGNPEVVLYNSDTNEILFQNN